MDPKSNNEIHALLEEYFSEEITKTTLDNGLTVLAKEDRSADVVSVQLWVKTGSIHEDSLLGSGVSHYVEHMLFKGTEKRSYKQITDEVQGAGGSMNAYTTFDRTVYYVNGPNESVETSIDVLADITLHSTFDAEEIKKEQSVILREIDMGLDDPDYLLSQNLFKTAFRLHPYRYPVIGEKSLFSKITRDDLLNYYKSRYVPNNMVLVVVGAVEPEHVNALAQKYFSEISQSTLPNVFIPEEPKQLSYRHSHEIGDYNIVRGSMTFQIPGLSHPDAPALAVLANILGQGQSSILWQHLREEQKLVHSISASIWNPGSKGLFWISYYCDLGKRDAVESAVLNELDMALKKTFDAQKVAKAVRQAMVGEVNVRKTMSGQASQIGITEVVVGALDYPRIFLNLLQQVIPQSLTEVHQKYLKKENLASTSLSPKPEEAAVSLKALKGEALPDFEEIKLKNGVRILLQPYKNLPKIHLRTAFLGGPLFEPERSRGITGVFATLLTKDTEQHTAAEISEIIETVGGAFCEFSGNNSFGLGLETMPTDFSVAVSLLRNALIQPCFTQENLIIERDAQIAAIREELDEIVDYGLRSLREKFFVNHPYSTPPLGTIEALQNLTLDDLEDHKNKLLSASNTILAVTGAFDRNEVLDSLTPFLEELPGVPVPQYAGAEFAGPKPGAYEEFLEKEQVVVFQAYPGVGATDPLYETSEVLDELLSGMSSNLFTLVREEQAMAYFVGASRMIGLHCGMFYFYAGTNTQSYHKVFSEIQKEISRIQEGNISEGEINRCKIRLKAAHRMGLQSLGNRAMKSALDTLYGLPTNAWRTYDKRIDDVTIESIQGFAKEKFTDTNKVTLAVGAIR